MLRREPIVNGHHEAPSIEGQATARDIVRIPIADHEASTVKIDENRERTLGTLWAIESCRKLATGTRDRAFVSCYSSRSLPRDRGNHLSVLDPRCRRIEILKRRAGTALREVEYELGLRV